MLSAKAVTEPVLSHVDGPADVLGAPVDPAGEVAVLIDLVVRSARIAPVTSPWFPAPVPHRTVRAKRAR